MTPTLCEIHVSYDQQGKLRGAHQKDWEDGKPGPPKRVAVNKIPGLLDVSKLITERDSAIAERDAARALVAELESQLDQVAPGIGNRRRITATAFQSRFSQRSERELSKATDASVIAFVARLEEFLASGDLLDLDSAELRGAITLFRTLGIVNEDEEAALLDDSIVSERT